MSDLPEPLPCPFCGKAPTMVSQMPEDRNYGMPDRSSECLTKDCAMYQHLIPVAAWNKRADTLPGLLAEAYTAGYEKFQSEEGGGGMWDEDLEEEAKEYADAILARIKGETK